MFNLQPATCNLHAAIYFVVFLSHLCGFVIFCVKSYKYSLDRETQYLKMALGSRLTHFVLWGSLMYNYILYNISNGDI